MIIRHNIVRVVFFCLTLIALAGCVRKESSENILSKDKNISSNKTIVKKKQFENTVFHNDVINTSLIRINGNIPFRTTRDSLLLLIKEEPIIFKVSEDCVSYGSNNDTLEFICFNDSTVVFVYYNDQVEFVSMNFDNRKNKIEIGEYKISSKTTFKELCEKFPNSCKEASIDNSSKETVMRFHPKEGFYESYEFWSIRFVENKIKYIRYNMTC